MAGCTAEHVTSRVIYLCSVLVMVVCGEACNNNDCVQRSPDTLLGIEALGDQPMSTQDSKDLCGSAAGAAQFDKAFNAAIDDNVKVLEPDQPSEATAAADEKSKADEKEEADLSKEVQEKASVKD